MQIGEILREAREEKSLTLDDIQEMTKIQKRYLVAIEQNEFQALPGRFYARAFIKEYAEVIDLDASVLLAEFDEEKIETKEEVAQYSRMERGRAPEEAKGSSFLSVIPTIIVIILIIGIIVVAWMFLQKSSNDAGDDVVQDDNEIIRDINEGKQANNENNDEEKENAGNENDENEPADEQEEETGGFEIEEIGEEGSPLSTMTFTYNGDQVEVELKADTDSYIELRGGSDKMYFADTLTANADLDVFDMSEEEKIYLNIGNAAGLTVLVNGVEMEYPVDKNEKVHQKIWINFVKN